MRNVQFCKEMFLWWRTNWRLGGTLDRATTVRYERTRRGALSEPIATVKAGELLLRMEYSGKYRILRVYIFAIYGKYIRSWRMQILTFYAAQVCPHPPTRDESGRFR